ncbi:phage tail termination protein [Escherichia coli]|uniref:phage tail termination protein n=1 Tax=Escherichia coli TaxID=562 RepID=UPI00139EEA31|nr:hypothetical protein [Escherichia coli]ELM7987249.1 hypothetical protein [Escherichia coli]ELM8044491.1 hypothetical protein [Escherichia coli]KAB3392220.1 hypothetical protein F9005_07335 [Escherichia coli]KAB3451381.1 hypothetical protein F9Z49_06410 [Escherichia coli]
MTPSMAARVRSMLEAAGLTAGFICQSLFWDDSGNKTDAFMVFKPGGGGILRQDEGGAYIVQLDVIGAINKDNYTSNSAMRIIDYVQDNPVSDPCIGYIESYGMPQPMQTVEGRAVFPLRFRCVYGD